MSLLGKEYEIHSSPHPDTLSYQAFLDDLVKTSPLYTLESLLLENDFDIDGPTIISEFALLLTTLQVPGPSDLFLDSNLLGVGAHFTVFKQDIAAVADFRANNPSYSNSYQTAAVKMPNFMLDAEQKLDLSESKNSRHVRSMMLEITALCHPSLRKHPNIVDLMAWGSSTRDWQEVPFIALEIANMDMASFLRDRNKVSIDEKHYLAHDIACGLDAVHEVGIVHGDLKLENVLIFGEPGHWIAKVADFGGAANIGKDGYWEGGGTIGWRAPEVRELYESGKALDLSVVDRADNYSFGLLLWSIFLKAKVGPPHDETELNVERIALEDLHNKRKNVPASLTIILQNSFSSLLNIDPRLRNYKIEPLLGAGCQEHNNGTANWHPVRENLDEHHAVNFEDGQPDWDMQEISQTIAEGLKLAFTRDESLSPGILYALIMKLLAQGQLLDSDTNDRNLLLDLLCAAARQGHRPSRSIIFRVHEYLDSLPPPDISNAKLSWIAESVSEGAFFLRSELQQMDTNLLKESITSFRNSGKFHSYYATSSSLHPSGSAEQYSQDGLPGSELTGSLNSHDDNVLHNAAISNQSLAFSELLCRSSLQDINAANTCGETPLYRACMAGLTSNVLQLLSRGAEGSTRTSEEGPGCLHWIFQFDASDINIVVEELINHGASIHVQSKQTITIPYPPFTLPVGTALHWAVEMSVPEAVTSLLRNGADPCLRDGRDPYGYDGSVRHLDRILPPDNTPFCVAERPTMGLNVFDLAVQNRDHTILNILFSKMSVNVADQVDEEGYSALHRLDGGHWLRTRHGTRIWKPCLEGSRQKQKEAAILTVNLLRDHGFELDRLSQPQKCAHSGIDFGRLSPLMMAIKHCHIDSVEALIEAGANVECVNNVGRTALHAFRDPNPQNLQSAIIGTLLHSKPDVNMRDMDGDSPLAAVARQRNLIVGLALLEHGADFCGRGGTPGDIGFGQNVLTMFCSCEINGIRERDEWMAMLLARFVFPRLREGNKRVKEEVMTNAGTNGGNFLHFTARSGLQKCCRLLLEEGVVDCNQLRTGKKIRHRDSVRGIVTYYSTPLDEVTKGAKSARRWASFSNKDTARFMLVFDETIKIIREYNGVRGETLKPKYFEPGNQKFDKESLIDAI